MCVYVLCRCVFLYVSLDVRWQVCMNIYIYTFAGKYELYVINYVCMWLFMQVYM